MDNGIPLIKPNIPEVSKWQKYIQQSYDMNFFSNGGPCSKELEERLKNFLGLNHKPVLVTNGTVALQVILEALEVEGEVLVPDFTFSATVSSVVYARCKPVLVGCNIGTLNMCLEDAKERLTDKTKALVVVQALGIACDYKKYEEFAEEHNLKLVFDSAACLGAEYLDFKKVGNSGHPEAFSLHATKTFGVGEGGLVTSDDPEFLAKVRTIINFGFNASRSSEVLGYNGKLSEFSSAIGLAVLDSLKQKLNNRSLISMYYDKLIDSKVESSGRHILRDKSPSRCKANQVYHLLLEDKTQADKYKNLLRQHNIGFRSYYTPIHMQEGLAKYCKVHEDSTIVSKYVYERIVCVPLFEGLVQEQQDLIISLI